MIREENNSTDGIGRIELAKLGHIDIEAMPRVLARLARLAGRHRRLVILALIAALGAAAFNLVMPRLLGHAVNYAFGLAGANAGGRSPLDATLLMTALTIVGASAVRGSLEGLQGYFGESLAQHVGYDLRMAFFAKLQQLSFGFHDKTHSGDLITRGMLDLEGVRAFLESGMLRIITLSILLAFGSWRLLDIDPYLAVLGLGFVPFALWRATRMGVLLRLSWQRLQQLMSDMTLGMEESLQGMRVVRAFAARSFELMKFDLVGEAALNLSIKRITLRMSSVSQMNFSYYVSMGLVLWVGAGKVSAGTISVGALTEFLTFITILQQPLRQVGMIVNSSARAAGAGARLFEVLDAVPDIQDAPGARPLPSGPGILRFENVDFSYPATPPGKMVLSGVSFELAPGKTIGIVGPPGSGKSALAQLIPRFYDVTAGRITLDGQDIRQISLASLRDHVTLVQQETFLFDASMHDNVAYAEPAAAATRVIGATATAQLHDHVAQLSAGYRTSVGERGVALSGGQRQRASIARGLLSAAPIIVFDDSTAAIDAVTERKLRSALAGAMCGGAKIIIAHRLRSLQDADEILVLREGQIIERGAHQTLLAFGGTYAELWALQEETAAASVPAEGPALSTVE